MLSCACVCAEVTDRRQTRKWLQEGVDEADEKKLDVRCSVSLVCQLLPERLTYVVAVVLVQWALAKAEELKLDAAPAIKAAREMKDRIQKEKVVLANLTKASLAGGYLKEGDQPNTDAVRAALEEAKKFEVRTAEGKKAQRWAVCCFTICLSVVFRLTILLSTADYALCCWTCARSCVPRWAPRTRSCGTRWSWW